jgi:hypothetical protein
VKNPSPTEVVENNETHILYEYAFSVSVLVLETIEKLCGHAYISCLVYLTINSDPPNTLEDYRKINNDFRKTSES